MAAFLLANMIYTDGLVSLFAFGGIYAAGTFGWNTIRDRQLRYYPGHRRHLRRVARRQARRCARAETRDRRQHARSCCWRSLRSCWSTRIHVFFVKVAPPSPGGALFASAAERAYLVLGCLIGAAGGPLQAASRTLADPDRAEGSHRAIFRAVRADRKGHLVHRAAADRNRSRRMTAKPEGGHGGAGAVFRCGAGAAGAGEGLSLPRSPDESSANAKRRAPSFEHAG